MAHAISIADSLVCQTEHTPDSAQFSAACRLAIADAKQKNRREKEENRRP
jgi:hypothetical protein